MRVFGSSGYLLSDARVEVRLVYTGFLVLALIGMATMAVLQWKHIGPTPGSDRHLLPRRRARRAR